MGWPNLVLKVLVGEGGVCAPKASCLLLPVALSTCMGWEEALVTDVRAEVPGPGAFSPWSVWNVGSCLPRYAGAGDIQIDGLGTACTP